RRIAARVELRTPEEPHRKAPASYGSFPVVSRSPSLRLRAARGIRHGYRARRRLGLRTRPRAGDDSVCSDAAPDLSVTSDIREKATRQPKLPRVVLDFLINLEIQADRKLHLPRAVSTVRVSIADRAETARAG